MPTLNRLQNRETQAWRLVLWIKDEEEGGNDGQQLFNL
jgi:hypothetical protein